MSEDVLEALTAECSGDRPHAGTLAWAPAWNVWLCCNCRSHRTDAELRIPLAEGKKPATPGYLYPQFQMLWLSKSSYLGL